MPRVPSKLLPLLADLDRAMRALSIPYAAIGGTVPAVLLDTPPDEEIHDVEAVVGVDAVAEFNALKERLDDYGFSRRRLPHRLEHRGGGLADLYPAGPALVAGGRVRLTPDFDFNAAGLAHAIPHARAVRIAGGPDLLVAPLALYAVITLVAYHDRREPKDALAVLHCLEHYLANDRRRYLVAHDGQGAPFEHTTAYLLGQDGRPFLDAASGRAVAAALDRFSDPYADVVGAVARQRGLVLVGEQERTAIVERFRWYRLGAGL